MSIESGQSSPTRQTSVTGGAGVTGADANPMLLSQQEIEKLQREHKGRVILVKITDQEGNPCHLAFAYPSEPQYQRFMSELGMDAKGDVIYRAGKTLLTDTLLHPGLSKFNELVSLMPGLVPEITGRLQAKAVPALVEEIKNV